MTTETEHVHSSVEGSDSKFFHPLRNVGKTVDQRIRSLQNAYLSGRPTALANMAELRRSISMPPGHNPEIWELTQYPVPSGTGDAPTREEWAVHVAMTLYAIHQQGRSQPAHQRGQTFGKVVNKLAADTGRDDTIWMRFTAILTTASIQNMREHLQNLVGQLHSNSYFLAVDYGALSDDLVALQNPRFANNIRLKWERDYYRVPTKTDEPSENPSTINRQN